MIKKVITSLKFVGLFLIFWGLNNGFLIEPLWQPVQAIFFACVTLAMFKYSKVKLIYWIYLVGLFYLLAMVMEISKVLILPNILASTGFGILVILVMLRSLKRSS